MIDISFAVDLKDGCDAEEIIRRAAEFAMRKLKKQASVNITVVSAEEIRRLNREFRDIDRVTDVLSFPAWDGSMYDITDGFLGDIAICLERACEQAVEYGHSVERELAFLTVHGMLHIMGYDHIKPEDEKIMFPLQEKILDEMGIKR